MKTANRTELQRLMRNPSQFSTRISELLGTEEWVVIETTIAGTSFVQEALKGFKEGNWGTVGVELKPDPDNKYDALAIEVQLQNRIATETHNVGYIPRELNGWIYPNILTEQYVAQFEECWSTANRKGKQVGATIRILTRINAQWPGKIAESKHSIYRFNRKPAQSNEVAKK